MFSQAHLMSESCDEQKKEHTPGTICWTEVVSTDTEGSKNFYGELFGWKVESMDMDGQKYDMLSHGQTGPIAGVIPMPDGGDEGDSKPFWINYIAVTDIQAAVEKARSLGAHICMDVTDLPMGKYAVITDPQGATFGIWQGCE